MEFNPPHFTGFSNKTTYRVPVGLEKLLKKLAHYDNMNGGQMNVFAEIVHCQVINLNVNLGWHSHICYKYDLSHSRSNFASCI